jgi:hypothetical protein
MDFKKKIATEKVNFTKARISVFTAVFKIMPG